MRTPPEACGSGRRRLCVSSRECVAAEEAVQLLHFTRGIVRLVERLEPRQFGLDEARERFTDLVTRHQRRASRIAFHYVRDAADADEAVQDAFVKAYSHIGTFREELPFEVWFTRILINGCLDRIKARKRREKWIAPPTIDASGVERNPAEFLPSRGPSPEDQVLRQERRRQLHAALGQLPERQRLVDSWLQP